MCWTYIKNNFNTVRDIKRDEKMGTHAIFLYKKKKNSIKAYIFSKLIFRINEIITKMSVGYIWNFKNDANIYPEERIN